MSRILLLAAVLLTLVVAGGCPSVTRRPASDTGSSGGTPGRAREVAKARAGETSGPVKETPPPATGSPIDYEVETESGTDYISLEFAREEDMPALTAVAQYVAAEPDELAAHLCAVWISVEDADGLTPEDAPEDVMIYKIVEEDAWLSVQFGPPWSEFYLDMHLAVAADGGYEVIEWEPIDYPEM